MLATAEKLIVYPPGEIRRLCSVNILYDAAAVLVASKHQLVTPRSAFENTRKSSGEESGIVFSALIAP